MTLIMSLMIALSALIMAPSQAPIQAPSQALSQAPIVAPSQALSYESPSVHTSPAPAPTVQALQAPSQAPVQAPVQAPRCEEDQPCWDCHTMGNLICGIDAPQPTAAPETVTAAPEPATADRTWIEPNFRDMDRKFTDEFPEFCPEGSAMAEDGSCVNLEFWD